MAGRSESFHSTICKFLHEAPVRFEIDKRFLFKYGKLSKSRLRIQNCLASTFHGVSCLNCSGPYRCAGAILGGKSLGYIFSWLLHILRDP